MIDCVRHFTVMFCFVSFLPAACSFTHFNFSEPMNSRSKLESYFLLTMCKLYIDVHRFLFYGTILFSFDNVFTLHCTFSGKKKSRSKGEV